MGMFIEENKKETLKNTSPRNIAFIVLGKFLSAVIVIGITAVLSLIYYIITCVFANSIANIQAVITTLIGFILVSMSYISFGM